MGFIAPFSKQLPDVTISQGWRPKLGDRVKWGQGSRGTIIGICPPTPKIPGSGWDILVKWDDYDLDDSWEDLCSLRWISNS